MAVACRKRLGFFPTASPRSDRSGSQAISILLPAKPGLRRRAAVEPVIGHLKAEHRMSRNYLRYHAILAAVGYNFRRLIRWLRLLLCQILIALMANLQPTPV
jgi:hypothetical protein